MAGIQTSIQIQDRMSSALNHITQSMSLMLNTFESAQATADRGIGAAAWETARQGIIQASAELVQYREELERAAAVPAPVLPAPTWTAVQSQPVFTNSGAERFVSEFQAVNQIAQQLYKTQKQISAQARSLTMAPPGMLDDMALMGNRVQTLAGRVKDLNNIPVDLRTDRVNNELEGMRGRLTQIHSVQETLNSAMSRMDISAANAAYRQLDEMVHATERDIRDNFTAQEQFNQSLEKGRVSAGGLGNSIKRYAAMLVSAVTAGKAISLADQVAQTTARLDLMNYGLDTTEQLQQKIFESAQRSRGAYQTTADAVAKLGMQARGAFSSNDELVAFAEQLNKTFVIAGASAQGVDSVMLQLTQSMASGKLQGEELNAVLDNAQPIVQNIADYMGVPVGQIKQLASEGAISAEIIKNAMFAAADETNARFAQMPMTFGQVASGIRNQALMAFQPALQQLSAVTQTTGFQNLVNLVLSGIQALSSGAVQALGMMGQAVLFARENLWWLIPVIGGVTAAVIAYKGAMFAYNTVQGVANGLKILAAISSVAHGAAITAEMTATTGLTASQLTFNAALLACPLTWIVVGIMAVVAAIAIWVNRVGGIRIAWLTCVNAVLTKADQLRLGFTTAWMYIQNGIDNMSYGFAAFKAGVLNTLGNLRAQGLMILQGFINSAIDMVNQLINTVNSITGAGIATITWTADFGSQAVMAEAEKRQQRASALADTKSRNEAAAKERLWDQMRLEGEMDAARTAREAEIKRLKAKGSAQKAAQNVSGGGASLSAYEDLAGGMGEIGGNTGKTAGNTAAMADSMDLAEEELKSMRDMAEQEVINRFTTAELTVNMGGITNQINSQMDLDGIGQYLDDVIFETLSTAAEGVY